MPVWKEACYVRRQVDQYFYNKNGSYHGYNPFEADRIMKQLPIKTVSENCMCLECEGVQTVYYDVTGLEELIAKSLACE